jgi:mono/diheme cytochrome c family protein
MENDKNEPQPLPMKAITAGVAGLFVVVAVAYLVLPAFFDSSPFGLLFHRGPAPWALDPEEQAKFKLTETQAKGRYHFLQYCASCHGPDGRGNGPTSSTLNRRPPNFLLPAPSGLQNSLDVAGVVKTLNEGLQGNQMPSFSHLPESVKQEIAEFVEHLHKNPALY